MSSFKDEVEALMFSFGNTARHEFRDKTLWSVWFVPDMLNNEQLQILPPGQVVSIGACGYVVEKREPTERGDWACRPYFHSHESAVQMFLGWMRRHRKDLVRDCVQEARAGRLYRTRQQGAAANRARAR